MIALGCDHGGWELKEAVKKHFDELKIEYEDFGCFNTESVDYPIYAKKVDPFENDRHDKIASCRCKRRKKWVSLTEF